MAGGVSGKPFDSKIQMSFLNVRADSSGEFQVLPGYRFIHLIAGGVEYRANDSMIHLRCGDALYFDGTVPHVLLNSSNEEAKLLVIDFIVWTARPGGDF